MTFLLTFLLFITAIFLIMLVLIQRGKGGGLVGALGGMGGQSAFGTKAGETITWVTVGVATFWILLCIASVKMLDTQSNNGPVIGAPDSKQSTPAGKTGGGKTPGTGNTAPASGNTAPASGANNTGSTVPAEAPPANK